MKHEYRVLIVDDEQEMRELIRLYLEKEGYLCQEAEDGEAALELLQKESFDLILLDIMMPKLDGVSLCQEVRVKSDIPIIFLTARGAEEDKVKGLKIGADDYIEKPFSPNELMARIDALLRRTRRNVSKEERLKVYGPLEINQKGRQVKFRGQKVTLTLKEFDLLVVFYSHVGQVLSREQLLEKVWGYDYVGSARTVDTHVKTLRLKLGDAGNFIQTVWGIGYMFQVQSS